MKIQPIHTPVVARKLYELYQNGPVNNTLNIGGPEVMKMGEMAQEWLRIQNKKKWLLPLPLFGSYRQTLYKGVLTCKEKAERSKTWHTWLAERYE